LFTFRDTLCYIFPAEFLNSTPEQPHRFLLSIPVALRSTTPAAAMSRTAAPTGAKTRLMSEMKALRKEKWIHFQDDDGEDSNILKWHFALMVINSDSPFNGGYFKAEMIFTDEYPYQPPKFRFLIYRQLA
jgi:hypothetical protein